MGVMNMGLPARKTDRRYTYGDYKDWPDDERWELIDGTAFNMSPAPSSDHQWISSQLSDALWNYFRDKPCRVYHAPFDVFFPETPDQEMNDVATVVQPDLVVICDKEKIVSRGCWGSPDLVVEILSPATSAKDFREKFELYERSGVREYWIVDPRARYVRVFSLDGTYGDGQLYDGEGTAISAIFEGFSVDVEELFSDLLSS